MTRLIGSIGGNVSAIGTSLILGTAKLKNGVYVKKNYVYPKGCVPLSHCPQNRSKIFHDQMSGESFHSNWSSGFSSLWQFCPEGLDSLQTDNKDLHHGHISVQK